MPPPLGRITAHSDVIYPRYAPAQFVGRAWLVDAVARFRDDAGARHLLIVGEPGSGKSAFVAYLAEIWNCPRHFLRADSVSGVTGLDPRAFLVSLGWQLHQKYGIGIFEAPAAVATTVTAAWTRDEAEVVGRVIEELHTLPFLPPAPRQVDVRVGVAAGASRVIGERVKKIVDSTLALPETTLLRVCVLEPARKIASLYPGETVVILVDALDEALASASSHFLDVIPSVADPDLPPNVRLVMTSRYAPPRFRPEDCLFLDDRQKGHRRQSQRDARAYIDRRLAEPPLSAHTGGWTKQKLARLRTRIEAGSDGGNFLYLYHLLNELAAAARAGRANWDRLPVPKGLDGIYRYFAVEKIKRATPLRDWVELYLPLLGTLAVVREPVSREQLARFAGVPAAYVDYILAEIEQFLDVTPGTEQNRFRLYHASFGEYLLDSARNRDYPLDTAACHDRIVAGSGGQTGAWDRLAWRDEQDGYLFRHLAAHLLAANRADEMFELVAGGTGWAEGHFAFSGSYAGYAGDVSLALAWAESPEGWDVGRQMRCALIKSSLHALAGRLPPRLLAALVAAGLWKPSAGLANVDQVPNEKQRAEALRRLLPLLDGEDTLLQAMAITRRLPAGQPLMDVLRALADALPSTLQPELLALIREAADGPPAAQYAYTFALHLVAAALPEALQREALEIARSFHDPAARLSALTAMRPVLDEGTQAAILAEALGLARGLADPAARARGLGLLAVHTAGAAAEEYLAAARAIADPAERVQLLADQGRLLPPAHHAALAQHFLEAAEQIGEAETRFYALVTGLDALPARLRGDLVTAALAAAGQVDIPRSRALNLALLASYVTGDLLDRVVDEAVEVMRQVGDSGDPLRPMLELSAALPEPRRGRVIEGLWEGQRHIEDEETRADWMASLAPRLPAGYREAAWEEAGELQDLSARLSVRRALLDSLPDETRGTAMQQILDEAGELSPEWRVLHTLRDVAPHLPGAPAALQRQALAMALGIEAPADRIDALVDVAAGLPPELQAQALRAALAAAWRVGDEAHQAEALTALAGALPDETRPAALQAAWSAIGRIAEPSRQAMALHAAVSQFPGLLTTRVIEVAGGIGDELYRSIALGRLAAHVGPALAPSALAAAAGIAEPAYRAAALMALARHLPADLVVHGRARDEALAAARLVEEPGRRARLLAEIGTMLPAERRAAVFQAAATAAAAIAAEGSRAEALAEIGRALPDETAGLVLAAAREIEQPGMRAWVLQRLADAWPQPQAAEAAQAAWESARGILDQDERAGLLGKLLPVLPAPLAGQVQGEVLDLLRGVTEPAPRVRLSAAIAARLPEGQKAEVLGAALQTVGQLPEARDRKWALGQLGPSLPGDLQGKAYALAAALTPDEVRVEAVLGLLADFPAALKEQAVRDVLAWARAGDDDHKVAEVLHKLAPQLPAALWGEALAAAHALSDGEARALALAWLAPSLPAHQQGELVTAVREMPGERWRTLVLSALAGRNPVVFRYVDVTGPKRGLEFQKAPAAPSQPLQADILSAAREMDHPSARAFVLLTLAPHLDGALRQTVLGEIMEAVKSSAGATWGLIALSWAVLFAELAAFWATVPPSDAQQEAALWRGLAAALATHPRPQLLTELATLAPLVARLGAPTAVEAAIAAVQDVAGWYP